MSISCFWRYTTGQRKQMFTNSNGGSEWLCSPFKVITIDAADAWSRLLDIKIHLSHLDKSHLIHRDLRKEESCKSGKPKNAVWNSGAEFPLSDPLCCDILTLYFILFILLNLFLLLNPLLQKGSLAVQS